MPPGGLACLCTAIGAETVPGPPGEQRLGLGEDRGLVMRQSHGGAAGVEKGRARGRFGVRRKLDREDRYAFLAAQIDFRTGRRHHPRGGERTAKQRSVGRQRRAFALHKDAARVLAFGFGDQKSFVTAQDIAAVQRRTGEHHGFLSSQEGTVIHGQYPNTIR